MKGTNKGNEVTSEFFEKQEQPNMSEYRDFTALSQVGFTSVYKVRRYGKWYILKTLGEEYRGKEPYESLLKKDFEIGITLDHVNIVRYLDYVNVPGYGNAITMEYVDGHTLDIFLSSAPDLEMKIRVFDQILNGVEYLHMHQIVHRDLKPQNIIISTNTDTVKIIDLGLADKSDYAILKESAGTRGYAAPEVIQNKEQADARADIYSLGKVLADMHLPSVYNKVISKCIHSQKEKRYQSIHELREAFNTKKRSLTWPTWLAAALVLAILSFFVIKKNHSDNQTDHNTVSQAKTDIHMSQNNQHTKVNSETSINETYPQKNEVDSPHKKGADVPQTAPLNTNDEATIETSKQGGEDITQHTADSIKLFNSLVAQGYKGIDKIFDKYKGLGKTDTINIFAFNQKKEKCTREMTDFVKPLLQKLGYPKTVGGRKLYWCMKFHSEEAVDKLSETYKVRPLTWKEERDIRREIRHRNYVQQRKADSVRNARNQGTEAAAL